MEFLLPVFIFAIAASVTPGPNNMMLTSSGATYGFFRTLPHMTGVMLGFPAMVALIGLGLAQLFLTIPFLQLALKIISIIYLLYLAWRIAWSDQAKGGSIAKPLTFTQAAAFQWVNPKAWVMAIGAIGTYTTGHGQRLGELAGIVLCFFIAGLLSTTLWAGFGTLIGNWLSSPLRLRIFNIIIALLLAASILPFIPHP